MILTELVPADAAALPVAAFRDHLRLGSGFADDAMQDPVLTACLTAAIAAVEGRTGKALLERTLQWSLSAWRDLGLQALPVAPVSAITGLAIIDRLQQAEEIEPTRYRLQPDAHRPRLVAAGLTLPTIPVGGHAEITFVAGFGPAWSDVPADISQAVMMLAATYYETRAASGGGDPGIPYAVAALIERHRNLRLLGGGML